MLLTPPLFAFGDFEDLTTWTDAGGLALTAGQADPFGGTGAYLLTSGAGGSSRFHIVTVTRNGRHFIGWFVKGGTSVSWLWWRDNTAGVTRYLVNLGWIAGLLNTVTLGSGTGVHAFVDVGGGWYFVLLGADGVVSGNENRLYITADAVGATTMLAYLRSAIVCGHPLDNAVVMPGHAPGFERAEAPDGSFDAWKTPARSMLDGEMGWIDGPPTMDPLHSGIDGAHEHIGVNVGWDAFLRSALDGEPVVFCADRAAASVNVPVSLLGPTPEERPTVEQTDGSKRFKVRLQATSVDAFRGY